MAKRKNKKKEQNRDFSNKIINVVILIAIVLFAIITYNRLGLFGASFDNVNSYLLGDYYLVVFISIVLCVLDRQFLRKFTHYRCLIGLIIINIGIILFASFDFEEGVIGKEVLDNFLKFDLLNLFTLENYNFNGGLLGVLLYSGMTILFAKEGTFYFMIALFLIGIILVIPFNFFIKSAEKVKKHVGSISDNKKEIEEMADDIYKTSPKLKPTKSKFNITVDDGVYENKTYEIADHTSTKIEIPEDKKEIITKPVVRYPKKNLNYHLPSLSLLNPIMKSNSFSINRSAAEIKGERIIEILNSFEIPCELINIHIGPSVTKFEIKPDRGVKISKILGLSNDIKMELAAKSIRIEAPIPGLSAVGIEIPNVEAIPVQMIELFKKIPVKLRNSPLLIALGKDLMGNVIFCELNKMPHLLVAGATGSGKSVCMNSIISSLLIRTRPDEIKIMLIDPKRVEFLPYRDIPHLFWPVIDDSNMAANALKRVVAIMEERYEKLADEGVRNLESYNEKINEWNKMCEEDERRELMPYVVVIIDELADLMVVAGKEVETSIQQITQKARAAGIHLIVATQRPSTDVITGVIKANIPSRIAFSVASQIDSRTILDAKGAEDLLGNGDMLYSPIGTLNPIRLQGVFIKDKEINNLTSYCKKQAKPDYEDSFFELENISNNGGVLSNSDESFSDVLYDDVVDFITDEQKCSISRLQRHFGIGYNRSAKIVDELERQGLIGPAQGSKPRSVYLKKETEEE